MAVAANELQPADADPALPIVAAAAGGSGDASSAGGAASPRAPGRARAAAAAALPRAAAAAVADQWFILGLGAAIGLAAALPNLGRSGGWLRAEWSVKVPAVVLIFVISGIGLKTRALIGAAGDAWLHVRVQALSLAAVPAAGYGLALGLRRVGFNHYLTEGLIVMACMPTTVSTNVVFTAKANGNEAAALVNAVLGNVLGVFVTPLWMSLFLDVSGQAPYAKVLVELTYTVIAPLILGQLLQYGAPKAVDWIKARVNTANVSQLCILLLVWATFCNTFADPRNAASARDAFAVLGLDAAVFFAASAAGLLIGYPPIGARARRALGADKKGDAVAIVICGATKTVALGVPLINVMYGKGRWAVDEPIWRRKAARLPVSA
ncbi:sodium bile acid cotransporter [Raphidocelis subcapitata]|uniref:Sodium bile acid cotransporter n=1 Tax=Raphidocelis subcapitata TaxID=307507 RepID=A0A2V0PCR8_9CHLO|nr:sodium bile acid cotransporter [Raphidocelis subcapitata]|eukprot:GBF95680.1 sodium bile acid cotransporter [Raphidocelis subcapitata]